MPTQRRGLRLVATDGHSHWAEPEIIGSVRRKLPTGGHETLYAYGIYCEFGGVPMAHYVGRDTVTGAACWQSTPYWFPSQAEAEAARDELAAQTQQGEGE